MLFHCIFFLTSNSLSLPLRLIHGQKILQVRHLSLRLMCWNAGALSVLFNETVRYNVLTNVAPVFDFFTFEDL